MISRVQQYNASTSSNYIKISVELEKKKKELLDLASLADVVCNLHSYHNLLTKFGTGYY